MTFTSGWVSPIVQSISPMMDQKWRAGSVLSREAAADFEVDVAVVGGGPAGYAISALMADTHGHSVVLVDPEPDALWPNNYGEWKDEWQTLSRRLEMPELMDCVLNEWPATDCYRWLRHAMG